MGRSGGLSLSDFDSKRSLVQPFQGGVDLVDVVLDLGADFIILVILICFMKKFVLNGHDRS